MSFHTFELEIDRLGNKKFIIMNQISKEGIVIPLSDEEYDQLCREIDI